MVECLIHGIGNHNKYLENVRKFSMRQQYYSTAAYKSLRLFFNNNLPAIRTLQLWYTSVDGSPGISLKYPSLFILDHIHVCVCMSQKKAGYFLC